MSRRWSLRQAWKLALYAVGVMAVSLGIAASFVQPRVAITTVAITVSLMTALVLGGVVLSRWRSSVRVRRSVVAASAVLGLIAVLWVALSDRSVQYAPTPISEVTVPARTVATLDEQRWRVRDEITIDRDAIATLNRIAKLARMAKPGSTDRPGLR